MYLKMVHNAKITIKIKNGSTYSNLVKFLDNGRSNY